MVGMVVNFYEFNQSDKQYQFLLKKILKCIELGIMTQK